MDDDNDLVRRLRAGDPDGLRGLYEKYKDDLLSVACFLTGERTAGEDVLHDVLVAFAGGARTLCVRGSLRAYLVTCVANRARDQLRRKQREPARLGEADPPATAVSSVADTVLKFEEAELLYRALASLPYEQREVITLHLHGGMTFKEIAREQNVSINTVQSRYRYGLDKLRSDLGVEAKA